MNYSRILPVAALLATFLSACSGSNKTAKVAPTSSTKSDAKLFVTSVESAAFFRHGPRAGLAADKTLPKQTVVKVIRPSFGYSKVELVTTGEQGYIASEELRPASSALIASAMTAPSVDPLTATSPDPAQTPAVEQFNLNSNDPRLVPPPEDLPPSELPAPAPEQ